MNIFRLSLLVLCFSAAVHGAEPGIRLPASPMPVAPVAVTDLPADAVFVVECDTPCLTLASRDGFVTITEEVGPLRIRGRFADTGKIESRSYKAKQLWIVEAIMPGEVELFIIPDGTKDPTKVIRRTLVVGGTVGKPVPPKPIDPILPKPDPPTPDQSPELLGLDTIVANAVRLNVPASERAFAAKLATNYREGAKNIANGTWPLTLAIKNQFTANNATAGYSEAVWRPVFKDIADRLADARAAGKFQTQQQYVAIWAELSHAFSEVVK